MNPIQRPVNHSQLFVKFHPQNGEARLPGFVMLTMLKCSNKLSRFNPGCSGGTMLQSVLMVARKPIVHGAFSGFCDLCNTACIIVCIILRSCDMFLWWH